MVMLVVGGAGYLTGKFGEHQSERRRGV